MPVLSPRFVLVVIAALAATLPGGVDAYDREAADCAACRAENPGVAQTPLGFEWPVQGTILRRFGEASDGTWCDGVDIMAEVGTPVLAAQQGRVIYAGSDLPSYGNLLLVAHPGGFITVYAHNSALLVATGDLVLRGQPIAILGEAGDTIEPVLHFQLRAGTDPLDPSPFLDRAETVRTAEVRQ